MPDDRDEPDPKLLWQWAGRATRPWIGWVFIGLGALLVLLGYLGVSREAIVAKQIPYLVSGGIGGVLLCIVGAYFLGTEELRKDSGRLDRLETLVQELHAVLLSRTDAPEPGTAEGPPDNGAASTVVAVRGGETFHQAGCVMVADKKAEQLTPDAARARGLSPCPLCEPAAASV
jgi:hypothetical protein